jgi:hypothetical protein
MPCKKADRCFVAQEAARRSTGGLRGMEAEALALKQRMAKPEMYASSKPERTSS